MGVPQTPLEQAMAALEHECCRRIMGALHLSGEFRHYRDPHNRHKVLCFHRDTALGGEPAPTPAQAALDALLLRQGIPEGDAR